MSFGSCKRFTYLFKVTTKSLNQAVKRNIERFPDSFMFQLTHEEYELILRSQFVTSKGRGGRQYNPYVFTEQGVAMLSSILKSDNAIKMSIKIINTFVKMRHYLINYSNTQKYYNDLTLQNNYDIKLLQELLDKLSERVNEIYFEGQIYDAYSKIKDIMFEAKKELIVIDNYADKTLLDMIKNINVDIILIISNKSKISKLEIEKYNKQYHNIKVIYNNTFHDRYFIIDKVKIYHSGTSINYAGSKTFSINILEDKIVKDNLIKEIERISNN